MRMRTTGAVLGIERIRRSFERARKFTSHCGDSQHPDARSNDRQRAQRPVLGYRTRELQRPRQDLVSRDAKPPPGHNFRSVAPSALVSSGDSKRTPESGTWRYPGSLYRNRHLLAVEVFAYVSTADYEVFLGIQQELLHLLAVEVFAYVSTADYEVFLGIQQELLLEILRVVERAGAALAVPLLESVHAEWLAPASR